MAAWNTITTQEEYQAALQRVDELIDVERTEATQNELTLLSFLIEVYEEDRYPIPNASPLRVLKFMMEMKGLRQQDLITVLGSKGNVSKILSGKAKLQLEHIHPLSTLLGIPVEALIPKAGYDFKITDEIAEDADPVTPRMIESETGIPMAMEPGSEWQKKVKKGGAPEKRKAKFKY